MDKPKYVLNTLLGEGEFGRVFAGINRNTRRRVAVKVSRDEGGETAYAALKHEGKMHAALTDVRGIPQLKACGASGSSYYLVFPLLGSSLDALARSSDPPDARECYAIGEALLRTLQQVHERDVVHRDVCPGNIMLDLGGQEVFLCDLGLACAYRAEGRHISNVAKGGLVGTPAFLSNYALAGERAARRDDIEGLAYTLWFCLARGSTPWEGTDRSMDEIVAIAKKDRRLQGVVDMISHTRTLKYAERPDYDLLASMMRKAGNRKNNST